MQRDLVERVEIECPNADKEFILHSLRRSITKFYKETQLLRDEVYIDTQCKVSDYLLPLPEGRDIVMIESVHIAPRVCDVILDSTWRPLHPAHHRHARGFWADVHHRNPSMVFNECLTADRKVAITYTWTPATQCDVSDINVLKYSDVIVDGALAVLYGSPADESVYNQNKSSRYEASYLAGINNARADSIQNQTVRPLFMEAPSFI